MKTIKVDDYNHQKLNELKQELDCPSINNVITHLIAINTVYEQSEIVRLVKE